MLAETVVVSEVYRKTLGANVRSLQLIGHQTKRPTWKRITIDARLSAQMTVGRWPNYAMAVNCGIEVWLPASQAVMHRVTPAEQRSLR